MLKTMVRMLTSMVGQRLPIMTTTTTLQEYARVILQTEILTMFHPPRH